MSRARVAFALLCGLAVCCSVMYMTADGADEHMAETIKGKDAGSSVGSTDVLKAGQIYTETPDGRMRLMDYFNNVEKEISSEVANRKADIASVRAQMARDFAFNAAARRKLKSAMLTQMAKNAKKCKDDLDAAMRRTQEKFQKQAALANKRWKATRKRDRQTLKMVAANRREAAKHLRLAVSAWQHATSSWAAATNAKIDQANKHVAANAAMIKENAKKARKDLEGAMRQWDGKIQNFRHEARKGRSKLAAQLKAQDKASRAWANNKIKALVANTAAQFNDVQSKMAKQRHAIDMAVRQATMRFMATLNAQKALEDKRYAQTVRNIAAARKEAKDRVGAAKKEFKVQILRLSSVVKEQVTKVNNRIDKTAGVVRANKAAQAKVNGNVNAELKRMVKLGNKRYKQHLKDDAELQRLIHKRKAETDRKLNKMALSFNQALGSVRHQLAKDRAHAESRLKKATSGVYAALYKQQEMQRKKNASMAAATRRMRLDAMDNIRRTKAAFIRKIKHLGKVVAKNDRKANKRIEHLTGIVRANEVKSRRGRQMIAALEEANKAELKTSIRKAIATGEKRAQAVEAKGAKMDKDTRWLLNNKLSTEITKLRKETNASVEALALQSKEARAEMKKEMLYAIRSAAKVAANDLKISIRQAKKKMVAFEKKAAKSHAKSAMARKALAARIARNAKSVSRMLRDSVATVGRSQLALRAETAKKIKKTNTRVDAYARRMAQDAKKAASSIKAMASSTMAKIAAEENRARKAVKGFKAKDAARQASALKFLRRQLSIAERQSNAKFGRAYRVLAKDRARADSALGAAVHGLNNALAKQAALADSRFSKTVKKLSDARAQAARQVAQLRKDFATQVSSVTAFTKRVETRLVGEISVVSGEVISMRANQMRVNRRVNAELKRIVRVSDARYSSAKRARGRLKRLMDENKQAAAAEVAALSTSLKTKLAHARARNARNRLEMAKDLSASTKKLYERMSQMQKSQLAASRRLGRATAAASLATRNALRRAKSQFASKITMLTNTVAANAKRAERDMAKITGVVHNTAKAAAADRKLIREQTRSMEADLNKSVVRAIQIGEAKAKAVEQRIAARLKKSKRYLQVELSQRCERMADNVFKIVNGKRQKIADNYLSLKAYAVAAADKVTDYVAKGKGRNLSSIGDLLKTVGALGAVRAPKAEGLGMGGSTIPPVFSGKNIKVPRAVAAINGLVNEYTQSTAQVRARWPMGLGKYLLDKLEISMMAKGVLQVDKVQGKPGNFVYVNGRSVGLSNKLNDFSGLASRMSVYEAVLAKLTSKLTVGPTKKNPKKFFAKPPEWQGQ